MKLAERASTTFAENSKASVQSAALTDEEPSRRKTTSAVEHTTGAGVELVVVVIVVVVIAVVAVVVAVVVEVVEERYTGSAWH